MDIIQTLQKNQDLWDLFTSKEEYSTALRDRFDRFPHYSSQNRTVLDPKVSKYLIEQGLRFEYPGNRPFAVFLSHDIDHLYTTKRSKIGEASNHLQSGRVSKGLKCISQMYSKKKPMWNFSEITDLEEKYGAKSTFFFLVDEPSNWDYNYPIEDCADVIKDLLNNRWEVGLHGGHDTYNSADEMKKGKERLERILKKPVAGYRNHYLRFRVPDTWVSLQEAGFLYDSTFGYADCAGFRNGMCHPFRPYNLNTKKPLELIEIPLAIMDGTLENYMRLDAANSWKIIKKLIDTVEGCNGVISILWHNHGFFEEQKELYEKILKYCADKEAWMTSGEEIIKWCEKMPGFSF